MSEPGPPPTRRWYRLAFAVGALGLLAGFGWWAYASTRLFNTVEDFPRVSAFGGQMTINTTGTHTFFIEGECLSCHDNEPNEYRAAATVAVVGPDGRELELRAAPERVYNTGTREGRAIWLFDVATPGSHRIDLDFDTTGTWDNRYPQTIAVGDGVGLPVRIVLPMVALASAGIAAGAAIAITTAVRRRRHLDQKMAIFGS